MKASSQRGFTLVELLVVIAIIGVMLAMSFPAIQASRELGRRTQCRANLAQIMLGLHSYQDAFDTLPAGVLNPDGPIRSEPVGRHLGWLVPLLPHVDQANTYRLVRLSDSVYDPANKPVREARPLLFVCPSEPGDVDVASNYAGCHHDVEAPIAADNHGVLFLNSHISRDDIPDGLSQTIFVGEKLADLADLGWMSGTRATLRNTGLAPNQPSSNLGSTVEGGDGKEGQPAAGAVSVEFVGGFASAHTGGLLVGFGDANVQFIADTIDLETWQKLGHRADGKLVKLHLDD